jgi:hypothetical protein
MKQIASLLALFALGSGCSSAAAPEASSVVAQSDKASTVQVESALRNAAVAEQTYFVEAQTYTDDLALLQQVGFNAPAGVDVRIATADATSFCIESSSAGGPIHIGTPEISLQPGVCA